MAQHHFVIAGTHSGCGKTTVALGLMAALQQRGLTVQPFKVGPDFIDPGHHTAVCGRPSRNLDTWMLPESVVHQTYSRAAADADVAIIEGVMALFDGRAPDDPRGSTADVARLVAAPVVLVVDAAGMAGSIAALIKGFREYDPRVQVVGVICNRVAGPRHYGYLEPAIRQQAGVVALGWLPRRAEWEVRQRHLGLTTAEDVGGAARWDVLGRAIGETVDIDRLLAHSKVGEETAPAATAAPDPQTAPLGKRRRVAVARDAAFCFYYPENLELLQSAGAEVIPFSPLTEAALPRDTDLLYLGGGYPELYATALAGNASMMQSIRSFHQGGGTIYAECGGLMYVGRELTCASGQTFGMLDLLPTRTIVRPRREALGYITLRTNRPTILGPAGTVARGHEFHYSRLEPLEPLSHAAEVEREGDAPRPDGYVCGNLLAGYAHLHFGSNPAIADALLRRCYTPSFLVTRPRSSLDKG